MTPDPDITERFDFALALVREAGDHALGFLADRAALVIKSKGLQDMASQADLETELLIKRRLDERVSGGRLPRRGDRCDGFRRGAGDSGGRPDRRDAALHLRAAELVRLDRLRARRGDPVRHGLCAVARRDLRRRGGDSGDAERAPVERHPGRSIRDGLTGFGYSLRVPPQEFLPMFGRFIEQGGMYYRDGSGALMLCNVAAGAAGRLHRAAHRLAGTASARWR